MKKYGSSEREGERREEHGQEDVEHPLLRVLRADLDDLLASRRPRPWSAPSSLMLRLDELDRAVGAGRDGLRRGAGEPVDHRAARDEARAGTAGSRIDGFGEFSVGDHGLT